MAKYYFNQIKFYNNPIKEAILLLNKSPEASQVNEE